MNCIHCQFLYLLGNLTQCTSVVDHCGWFAPFALQTGGANHYVLP
jgi:hypothetical protein